MTRMGLVEKRDLLEGVFSPSSRRGFWQNQQRATSMHGPGNPSDSGVGNAHQRPLEAVAELGTAFGETVNCNLNIEQLSSSWIRVSDPKVLKMVRCGVASFPRHQDSSMFSSFDVPRSAIR
ncbi:predicted protein [Coccidioides posadasii str. Silveira]|uniref:Predicted protein n=1 Tax=Coccidioides posadasii (strain RMSCC 757 / Silveira) TaxID=443226 RepID=E9DJS5_COCPS|nr:predicted protein [Coccidioides posadasii str. Silveira]